LHGLGDAQAATLALRKGVTRSVDPFIVQGRAGVSGVRGSGSGSGRAVQVEPMKPKLKAPGTKRLKPKHVDLLSIFAFKTTCAAA
jgi:hypothetical protein